MNTLIFISIICGWSGILLCFIGMGTEIAWNILQPHPQSKKKPEPISTGIGWSRSCFWKTLRHWPLLHIYITVPFLMIRTVLMNESISSMHREYVMLEIYIHKWKFEFHLYDSARRIESYK